VKFDVSLTVEADSIDEAAETVAAILTRADADDSVVADVVTRSAPRPILHFAEGTPE
jgi:hypothetical protein